MSYKWRDPRRKQKLSPEQIEINRLKTQALRDRKQISLLIANLKKQRARLEKKTEQNQRLTKRVAKLERIVNHSIETDPYLELDKMVKHCKTCGVQVLGTEFCTFCQRMEDQKNEVPDLPADRG